MARVARLLKTMMKAVLLLTVVFVLMVNRSKHEFSDVNESPHDEFWMMSRPKTKLEYTSQNLEQSSPFNVIKMKTNYTSLYHDYGNRVDLRIIVLTYDRPLSLNKTLNSLQDFVTDGYRVALEIWIDQSENSHEIDLETLRVARNFKWTNGAATIWRHTRHVGLIGQWLYTWRPRLIEGRVDSSELALFLEDDVDVSRYGYRWLRAVRQKYRHRTDVACYTLQDENAIGSYGKYTNKEIKKPDDSPVFFHRLPGSWAMSPDPRKWREFQDWFEIKRRQRTFRPYVNKAKIQTEWYKIFEKQSRQHTMWTMWYIYYTSERNQLCAYANLPTYTKKANMSLASNRREPGLHYNKQLQQRYKTPDLLTSWSDNYVHFPDRPPMFDFGGESIA